MADDAIKPKNIYQRVQDVMRDVSYVRKEEKKVNNQYRFVSHDAVAAKIHEAVVRHGIVVIPGVIPSSIKRDGNRVDLVLESLFVNVDDPSDRFSVTFPGEGIDPQDKGCGKAMSYAVKYTLLKVFMLETGDDPEVDDIDHDPNAKAPAKGFVPKYQRGKPDVLPPVGEIPDHSAASPSGATADPAAGKAASISVGFVNNLAAASTLGQIDGIVKGIVLIAGKLTEEEKASLRDAAAAARLRVAATPAKLVDVPALLREITGLKSQLGDGMFQVILKKHGGENVAGYGLGTDGLKALRAECHAAIG